MNEIDGRLAALEVAIQVLIATHPSPSNVRALLQRLEGKSRMLGEEVPEAWLQGYRRTMDMIDVEPPPP